MVGLGCSLVILTIIWKILELAVNHTNNCAFGLKMHTARRLIHPLSNTHQKETFSPAVC